MKHTTTKKLIESEFKHAHYQNFGLCFMQNHQITALNKSLPFKCRLIDYSLNSHSKTKQKITWNLHLLISSVLIFSCICLVTRFVKNEWFSLVVIESFSNSLWKRIFQFDVTLQSFFVVFFECFFLLRNFKIEIFKIHIYYFPFQSIVITIIYK